MGELIPLADYAIGERVLGVTADESPWLRPDPGDWDPCDGCPVRGACREVRECQWGDPWDTVNEPPGIALRLVEPPDIVA